LKPIIAWKGSRETPYGQFGETTIQNETKSSEIVRTFFLEHILINQLKTKRCNLILKKQPK
jgi:hypothetical protein